MNPVLGAALFVLDRVRTVLLAMSFIILIKIAMSLAV
jgi:hypothetical protein